MWIHGGEFARGSSSEYPGDTLAALNDVVVVTINYRTSAFGFLANMVSLLGNYGLWDQRLAIEWVKENIKDYGGNPKSITLFGESGGGLSITCHLISLSTPRNLFQRAITQSGSIMGLRVFSISSLPMYAMVADSTGCAVADDAVACLKALSVEELATASAAVNFFTTFDGEFLSPAVVDELASFVNNNYSPLTSTILKRLGEYDILSGWNSQEALFYTPILKLLAGGDLSNGISEEVLKATVNILLRGTFQESGELILDLTVRHYMNNPRPMISDGRSESDRRVEAFVDIMSKYFIKFIIVQKVQCCRIANIVKVKQLRDFLRLAPFTLKIAIQKCIMITNYSFPN